VKEEVLELDIVYFCFINPLSSWSHTFTLNAGLPLWCEFSTKVWIMTFRSKVVWSKSDFYLKVWIWDYFKYQPWSVSIFNIILQYSSKKRVVLHIKWLLLWMTSVTLIQGIILHIKWLLLWMTSVTVIQIMHVFWLHSSLCRLI